MPHEAEGRGSPGQAALRGRVWLTQTSPHVGNPADRTNSLAGRSRVSLRNTVLAGLEKWGSYEGLKVS
jgi:hypothetical protein